jgi:hypothetical protein
MFLVFPGLLQQNKSVIPYGGFIVESEKTCAEAVWKRIHSPEEYASDAAKWMAGEMGLPFIVVSPFVPLIKSIFSRWEPAAEEYSALVHDAGGAPIFRTFFKITNYSNHAVYEMMEGVLKRIGVGRSSLKKKPEIDFKWVLLGGVLGEYGVKAGLCEDSICKLLDFRLRNSDYFTATTWFAERVEIANLISESVESLELPPNEIKRVVDWSINFHKTCCGRSTTAVTSGCADYRRYMDLDGIYRGVKNQLPAI